jgi:ergothioneine biosynthesis protein EgtB
MTAPMPLSTQPEAPVERRDFLDRYREVRSRSIHLCAPLAPEDMVVQPMPDASPTKWHLAHTTWFFEALVLRESDRARPWYNETYAYLFNSYYNSLGRQFPRPRRGLISRPTVAEVMEYRRAVDIAVEELLTVAPDELFERLAPVVVIGTHHEEQHQELMLTDIKNVLAQNPLWPVYRERQVESGGLASPLGWLRHGGGVVEMGHDGETFAYDNEGPRHEVLLRPFELGSRLVTCGEFLEFMADRGYERPELWLSEGWARCREERWRAPLYWEPRDGAWWQFTLAGLRPVEVDEPVCHVSLFEADAYARWAGARLPTEAEWEAVAAARPISGTFMDDERFHPTPATSGAEVVQLFGDVWEWTSSAYAPYPGYRADEGALGEYNGKFMCNQHVLRGGSCATPRAHIRSSYRNFWPAHTRFQFSGIRLARDAERET